MTFVACSMAVMMKQCGRVQGMLCDLLCVICYLDHDKLYSPVKLCISDALFGIRVRGENFR